jgi:hypothetical protein
MTILISGPFVVTIGTSVCRLYPFEDRLIVFLIPFVIILLGSGIVSVFDWIKEKSRIMASVFMIIFLIIPLSDVVRRSVHPYGDENARPVIEYVLNKKSADQDMYVYYGAIPAFEYYSVYRFRYQGSWMRGEKSRNNLTKYSDEISRLFSNRTTSVWVIFSHVWAAEGIDEEKYFVTELNKIAVQKDYYHAIGGASAYCYAPRTSMR